MAKPTHLTLAGARDALKKREISSVELTTAHVAAVESLRGLNAFVTETPEKAIEMAKASDARLARGEGGPLEGGAGDRAAAGRAPGSPALRHQ